MKSRRPITSGRLSARTAAWRRDETALRRPWALAAALLALLLARAACADAIKMGGVWVDNVQIQNVANGQVSYTTATGNDVERPLASVEGLRLNAYPELEAAQKALDAGKAAEALPGLLKVASGARQAWARQWAQSRLLIAYDKTAKPIEATELFLQLLRDRAPDSYLENPPLKALKGASPEQKADILSRLKSASASGAAEEALKSMISAVKVAPAAKPDEASATPGTPTAAAPTGVPGLPGVAPAGSVAASAAADDEDAVILPKAIDAKDPVAQLLRKGQYQAALEAVDKILSQPTFEMALRLYEKGMAEMGLAAAKNDLKLYKNAGLSFMRVVIYFSRSKSAYVGPSLIEAGLVHQKIGRPDTATKLWEQAKLLIDSDTDPQLAARLEALIAGEGNGQK